MWHHALRRGSTYCECACDTLSEQNGPQTSKLLAHMIYSFLKGLRLAINSKKVLRTWVCFSNFLILESTNLLPVSFPVTRCNNFQITRSNNFAFGHSLRSTNSLPVTCFQSHREKWSTRPRALFLWLGQKLVRINPIVHSDPCFNSFTDGVKIN